MVARNEATEARILDAVLQQATACVERVFLLPPQGVGSVPEWTVLVVEEVEESESFAEEERLQERLNALELPLALYALGVEEYERERSEPGTVAYAAENEGRLIHERSS